MIGIVVGGFNVDIVFFIIVCIICFILFIFVGVFLGWGIGIVKGFIIVGIKFLKVMFKFDIIGLGDGIWGLYIWLVCDCLFIRRWFSCNDFIFMGLVIWICLCKVVVGGIRYKIIMRVFILIELYYWMIIYCF